MEGTILSILQSAMNINDDVGEMHKYAHGGAAHCVCSASFALRRALEGRSNGAGFLIVSLDPSSVSEVMRKPKATLGRISKYEIYSHCMRHRSEAACRSCQ